MSDSLANPPPAQFRVIELYDALLTWLDRLASLVVITLMAVLTVVIVLQVLFRYGFNSSLDWGWEVPRLCFISVAFIAMPIGFKRGLHVGVDLFSKQLSEELQRALLRMGAIIMAALLLTIAYYAAQLARDTWDQRMPTLNLSTGVFYVVLIIGSLHSVLHLARICWTGAAPVAESLSE